MHFNNVAGREHSDRKAACRLFMHAPDAERHKCPHYNSHAASKQPVQTELHKKERKMCLLLEELYIHSSDFCTECL